MLKINFFFVKTCSSFHTVAPLASQQGKAFRKIMGVSNKKKKFYVSVDNPMLPSVNMKWGKSSVETKITGNSQRSNVLNKVFMRHVTDLMATGDYSKELLGYGIEINKVKVSPDYQFLNVYWMAPGTEDYEEIDKLLQKNAGLLRHELSSLMSLGHVPTIMFVRDKSYCKLAEVQSRLQKADFGEDFQSSGTNSTFKSEIDILFTAIDQNLKPKIMELKDNESQIIVDETLPPMPQNVLGLNHADILQRVKKGMSLSKAEHRNKDWAQWSKFKVEQSVNVNPVEFINNQEQRKAFKEFLEKRQILKMKQERRNKKWSADIEPFNDELRELHIRNLEVSEDEYEEDFIDENEEIVTKY